MTFVRKLMWLIFVRSTKLWKFVFTTGIQMWIDGRPQFTKISTFFFVCLSQLVRATCPSPFRPDESHLGTAGYRRKTALIFPSMEKVWRQTVDLQLALFNLPFKHAFELPCAGGACKCYCWARQAKKEHNQQFWTWNKEDWCRAIEKNLGEWRSPTASGVQATYMMYVCDARNCKYLGWNTLDNYWMMIFHESVFTRFIDRVSVIINMMALLWPLGSDWQQLNYLNATVRWDKGTKNLKTLNYEFDTETKTSEAEFKLTVHVQPDAVKLVLGCHWCM